MSRLRPGVARAIIALSGLGSAMGELGRAAAQAKGAAEDLGEAMPPERSEALDRALERRARRAARRLREVARGGWGR